MTDIRCLVCGGRGCTESRPAMTADHSGCPAVQFHGWGITRCTKPAGHPPVRGVVWHSGSGRYIDEDGEPDVYGTAWRYSLELTS
jgi:hypothetical protein